MSTTKIQGRVMPNEVQEPQRAVIRLLTRPNDQAPDDLPALLFIGSDGKPPVVYTEEEHEQKFQERAKAMLREILATKYDYRESEGIVNAHQIEAIAAKHGITLP